LGGKRFVARSVAWAITYLTLRTVLNSLRRLLASPLRALLALAIVGYLAYDEVSELLESSPDPETAQLLLGGLSAQEQVQGLVAIAVLIHGWFLVFRMAPAALDATRSLVLASDVDYLFATPLPSLRLFWGWRWRARRRAHCRCCCRWRSMCCWWWRAQRARRI
jgi:hypothetical protein